MNSLEGRRGQPRIKPPFPAASGAFAAPTTINNVETVCGVPHIMTNGGEWYRQCGTEKSPGTKMFNVSRPRGAAGQLRAAAGLPHGGADLRHLRRDPERPEAEGGDPGR